MSTNSTITAKCSDGKFRSIYCHWDGYISHNGKILVESYTDQDRIDSLVALGSLSGLNKSTEKPEGHDFYNRVEGVCVAYHRDRDEPLRIGEGDTAEDAFNDNKFGIEEFNYLWDGNEWLLLQMKYDEFGKKAIISGAEPLAPLVQAIKNRKFR